MPTEVVSFIGYGETRGAKPTPRDVFEAELKKHPAKAVVRLCSLLNAVLSSWRTPKDLGLQAGLVRSAFPADLADPIVRQHRPVFHRQQLLFTGREALRWSPADGPPPIPKHWGGLGTVLLMANDQLHCPLPEPPDDLTKFLTMVSTLIPVIEANNFQGFLHKMARSYLILSRFIEPFRGSTGYFDIAQLFEEATGLSLTVYQALLCGALARAMKVDVRKAIANPQEFTIPRNWFATTRCEKTDIERFFADVSLSAADFSARLANKVPNVNDFTLFRDRPLLNEPDALFPIDFAFLAEKFDTGPFWRVHNELPEARKEPFHSFWGSVFERYMNWLLMETCSPRHNRVCPDPRYQADPERQVCDAIILCDRVAVLVEHKGSTFTADAKYSGNVETLRAEIERKLVAHKGVEQLAAAADRLAGFGPAAQVENLDLGGVSTLCPLLVLRDDIGSVPCLNAYLNARFQEMKPRKTLRSIMPLFCVTAEDLEAISSVLATVPLSKILAARKKADPLLRNSFAFSIADNRVINEKDRPEPTILKNATHELLALSGKTMGLEPP